MSHQEPRERQHAQLEQMPRGVLRRALSNVGFHPSNKQIEAAWDHLVDWWISGMSSEELQQRTGWGRTTVSAERRVWHGPRNP